MQRRRRLGTATAALAAAAALAACGGGDDGDNASRFSGPSRQVAQVVDELQKASRDGDAERICNRLFTPKLVRDIALSTGGRSCIDRVKQKLVSDDAKLTVRSINVAGAEATAVVREQNGNVTRLGFRRVGDRWRVDSIGNARG